MNFITPEIARIHAHICGDGYVYMSKEKRSPGTLIKHPREKLSRNIEILVYTNDCDELISEFANDMIVAFDRKATIVGDKHKEARVRNAKRIINLLNFYNKDSYSWSIPNMILNSDEEIIANWLRAFFDDEGWVDRSGKIGVCSVNKKGLLQVAGLLKKLQIEHGFYSHHTNNGHTINIRKRSAVRFLELVSFTHPKKKERLKKFYGAAGI